MKKTFFYELEELEKQEQREKEEKKRVELYLRKKPYAFRDYFPFFSIVLMAITSGISAVYALYLFIDITRITDIADVHISKNINLAKNSLGGKLYSDPKMGIKNWTVFSDKDSGIEIRYPDSWKKRKTEEYIFEIRKYNSQVSKNESLAAAIFVSKWKNEENLDLLTFVSEKTELEKTILQKRSLGEVDLVETGLQKNDTGLTYSMFFWERNGNIYSFKSLFYNQQNKISEDEVKKIVSVIRITK